MDSTPVIVLDVGGTLFRTTKTTLSSVDSFFSRMASETWREGSSTAAASTSLACDTSGEDTPSKPSSQSSSQSQHQQQSYVFIDRDPACFPQILSYLRSQQISLDDCDRSYLEKLLCEADYYQLEHLGQSVRDEIANRQHRRGDGEEEDETVNSTEVYRAVQPADVNAYFEQGWAFVSSYEANETAACSATGSKVTAQWRNNQCSVCCFTMTYEKFVKHASFYKPTVVVVKKPKRGSMGPSGLGLGLGMELGMGMGLGMGGARSFSNGVGSIGMRGMGAGLMSPVPSAGGHGNGHGPGVVPFAGFGALEVDASFG